MVPIKVNIFPDLLSFQSSASVCDTKSRAFRDCVWLRRLFDLTCVFLGSLMNILVLAVLVICQHPHNETPRRRRQVPTRLINSRPNRFPVSLSLSSGCFTGAPSHSKIQDFILGCVGSAVGNMIPCHWERSGSSSGLLHVVWCCRQHHQNHLTSSVERLP